MCIDGVRPLEGRNPMCAEQSHGHIPKLLSGFLSLSSFLASLSFGYWEWCRGFLEKGDEERSVTGSCHESSSQVLASPAEQHGLDCMLLFMWLNFLAALHGHSCIFCCHDNQAGPALGRSVCTYRVSTVVWGSNTEWPLLMPHRKCVRSMSSKTKAPDQPMRFCFLCGPYWCLLSTYILIYLEKTGDIR